MNRSLNYPGRGLAALTAAVLLFTLQSACGYEAEVRWTRYGVPHIKAQDYAGLGYGYGYAVASHHLCLLSDQVWTLRGDRSRLFGADGPATAGFMPTTNLDSDLFYKVQLSDALVDTGWNQLSKDARGLARGYAAGFNRYVRELSSDTRSRMCGDAPLPSMQYSDVVRAVMQIGTIWKALSIAGATSRSTWDELRSPTVSDPAKQTVSEEGSSPSIHRKMASNAWAYGSDVTGTDSAIVVANPHTMWQPHWLMMHQMHLTIPGEVDVMGADFVGLPVPVAGFTRHTAWSIEAPSTVKYDVLLRLQVRRNPAPSYTVDARQRKFTFKNIELDIRNDDGSVHPQSFKIPFSHLGPVYLLDAGDGRPAGWYAITDANTGNARGLDQMLAVAKARNIDEFERAVADNRGFTAHLIAGDHDGKAIYIESGPLLDIDNDQLLQCFAVRQSWQSGAASGPRNVLNGAKSECSVRNPDLTPKLAPAVDIPALSTRGIVHNANDSYRFALLGQASSGYSYLLGDPLEPSLGARTLMSQRHIENAMDDGRISVTEAASLVWSNRNYAAETSLDAVLTACKPSEATSPEGRACSILEAWDRHNNIDSRGALLFHVAWPKLQEIKGIYSEPFAATRPWRVRPISQEPAVTHGIVEALSASIKELEELGLQGDEPWGKILTRNGPQGREPLHGGDDGQGVLNVIEGQSLQSTGFARIGHGSSYIQVVTWKKGRPVAGALLAHGQSSDPESVHYSDQIHLFQQKRLIAAPFTNAEIEADSEYTVLKLRD